MTIRLALIGLLTAMVLTPMALVAPAANAAWGSVIKVDGAKLQVCKEPLGDGRTRIKVRLDNRQAKHTHLGGMSRTRDGRRIDVDLRAPAGRLTASKSLIRKPGDQLVAGIGEVTGEGAGGDIALSDIPRC